MNEHAFRSASSPNGREHNTLFVAAFSSPCAKRRAKIHAILASFGVEVAPGAFEIATTHFGRRSLEAALALHLTDEDDMRIYLVCESCRASTRGWGETTLVVGQSALIF
jgi:hypothetical protein